MIERGASVAQAAREFTLHEDVLRKWIWEASADPQCAFSGRGVMRPEHAETDRRRKEIAPLKMERDILKTPQPTQPWTRCEANVRCDTPRGLASGDVVRCDRCLAKRLLCVAAYGAWFRFTRPTTTGRKPFSFAIAPRHRQVSSLVMVNTLAFPAVCLPLILRSSPRSKALPPRGTRAPTRGSWR